MTRLVDMRRWLDEGEQPTMKYFFELYSGERGEADSPLALFDLLAEPTYSDCDDRATQLMLLGILLKDVAVRSLGASGIRATVYSGVGPFYDNMISRYPDEVEEEGELEFENEDDPVILDFWDEWTTLASLIKCGYLKFYERISTFGGGQQERECGSCMYFEPSANFCPAWQAGNVKERMVGCPFWTTAGQDLSVDYIEVMPEDVQEEPTWIPNYVKIEERNEEFELFRVRG